MNTVTAINMLSAYLALPAEERAAFDLARDALAASGIAASRPTRSTPLDGVPSQLSFNGLGIADAAKVTAPLPLGSGQRTPRLQVPAHDPAVFGSAGYRKLATARVVHLYVASSLGTAALYRDSATTIYKVGTTTGCVAARIAGLNAVGYAGWHRSGETLREEQGYRSWRAERLPVTSPRPHGSPVTVTDEGLAVALPALLSPAAFDIALTERLAPVSITRLLGEPRFRLGLASCGFDAERLERYSPRSDGPGHKRAAELMRLQPRRDADTLATLAEGIVASHVQQAAALAA